MAIEDRNLTVGTRLVANYRKQAHACMVEKAEEGDGILFVLEDGRKFKSASSAASAVMGGKAVNGWRFWSVQGIEPKAQEGGEKLETQASKSKRLVYRVPNQKGLTEGQSRRNTWNAWPVITTISMSSRLMRWRRGRQSTSKA